MITFVTSFIKLKDSRYSNRPTDGYVSFFGKLAKTGVNIHLFLDDSMTDVGDNIIKEFPNVFLEYTNIKDSWTFQNSTEITNLPGNRNQDKDTLEYLLLMNSKLDFMELAIKKNPFGSEYFSWIDFGIFHVMKEEIIAQNIIKRLSECKLIKNRIISPAGIYPSISNDAVWNGIHWRFLGGFFLGHVDVMNLFISKYKYFFLKECAEKHRITWEVNIWNLLESNFEVSFAMYIANHDISMICVPGKFLTK